MSDDHGAFEVPSLRVGQYDVRFSGSRYRDSYSESYYLSMQRQLAKNTLLDNAM